MWVKVRDQLPPELCEVNTKIDDGKSVLNIQHLTRSGALWFHPDMKMYVYYTPTHWEFPEE